MDALLNEVEVRVLGSLIEKETTTPEYYPLSVNALTNACNQSSNRHPVVHFDEDTVSEALDSLREKRFVHQVDRADSRVTRYRHVMAETLSLEKRDVAVMCVLMLRGPQTVGEVRTRSNRIYDFANLGEVETTLNSLIGRKPLPLVVRLPRQTGHKEVRYAHLLSGEVTFDDQTGQDRISKLEEATEELRKALDDLRQQFDQFKRQFE